jgi:hypothetical protein
MPAKLDAPPATRLDALLRRLAASPDPKVALWAKRLLRGDKGKRTT